jgi:16S rRNA (uracil1498-N3)-methyltransferase
MRRALSGPLPLKPGTLVPLDDQEAKHMTAVLRLGPGDEIELLDGQGMKARANLVFRDKKVFAELTEVPNTDTRFVSAPIHLSIGIIKGDAMEWVVEKAVEMGVKSLTPVETEFTVVKIHKKGAEAFQERWQRIADQAIKQCGRLDRMVIHAPVVFEEALLQKQHFIWLDEVLSENGTPDDHLAKLLPTLSPRSDYALFVGPEGGFSPTERARLLQLTGSEKHEITRAGLGALILRAETAALMGAAILIGDYYGRKK